MGCLFSRGKYSVAAERARQHKHIHCSLPITYNRCNRSDITYNRHNYHFGSIRTSILISIIIVIIMISLALSQLALRLPIPTWLVVAMLAALTMSFVFALRQRQRSRNSSQNMEQRERGMKVAGLFIHPVKSCRGVAVGSVTYTSSGCEYDRQAMIVNAHTGRMVSAREKPQMVRISATVDAANNRLLLDYAGQRQLSLPLNYEPERNQAGWGEEMEVELWKQQTRARSYDDMAAKWITQILNEDVAPNASGELPSYRIVTLSPSHHREIEEKFRFPTSETIKPRFQDGYPFLLTSAASLRKLNTWTTPRGRDVEMRSFRPNIVIDGGLLDGFEEDTWMKIQIGDDESQTFWVAKPCDRCVLTTVEPSTGKRHQTGEPLISLRENRKGSSMEPDLPLFKNSVFFGQNLLPCSASGRIRVGDVVRVIERRKHFIEFAPGSQEAKERK